MVVGGSMVVVAPGVHHVQAFLQVSLHVLGQILGREDDPSIGTVGQYSCGAAAYSCGAAAYSCGAAAV